MKNLIVIAIALGGFALAQEPVVRITPEQVTWVRDTDGSGVERATISGDPTKPGLYIIQVKFPPGTMSLNHYHPEDRHVTVLKGTWYTGTGDELLPDQTIPLKPGSYMKHPAGVHHFDGAKDEEVILQIVGIGPTGTTRLRPELGNYTHILSGGEGKKIVESQCGACHTVERATAVYQDRDKWNATVRKMVGYGAPMSEREVALAVDYLAKNFGPR